MGQWDDGFATLAAKLESVEPAAIEDSPMTFIRIGNTLFNYSQIRKVIESPDKKVTIEYTNGETESIEHKNAYRAFSHLGNATIIPVAPGFVKLTCQFRDEPPSLEKIDREPILGWRVWKEGRMSGCDPVTMMDAGHSSNVATAILCPDGSVVIPLVRARDSIESWLEYVRDEWKEWQEDQKTEVAS